MCFLFDGIGIFDLSRTMYTYSELCHNFVIKYWGLHLDPNMVPQEPSFPHLKTNNSVVRAYRNPNMVPQEPSVSQHKANGFVVRAFRNPNMVPHRDHQFPSRLLWREPSGTQTWFHRNNQFPPIKQSFLWCRGSGTQTWFHRNHPLPLIKRSFFEC